MKIAVVLQHREKSTPKPWRFNPSDIQNYCLADVEEDVLTLFPDVAKRGSRLIFRYKDSLVGEVELESDRDLRVSKELKNCDKYPCTTPDIDCENPYCILQQNKYQKLKNYTLKEIMKFRP